MSKYNIDRKRILITGGSGGIGKAAAIQLAKLSHQVIITGRNEARAQQAVDEIKRLSHNDQISYFLADMSSLSDLQSLFSAFKSKYDKLDVLINNVGIVAHERQLSKDNIEMNFAVHTFAPYVLYKRLLPLLENSAHARVVNVLTQNHAMVSGKSLSDYESKNGYIGMNEYGKTKLYNLWWLYDLANSISASEISFFGVDPGANNTQLMKDAMQTGRSWPIGLRVLRPLMLPIMRRFLKNKPISEGAKPLVYAADSTDLTGKTGLYINDKGMIGKSSKLSYNRKKQIEMGAFVEKMFQEKVNTFKKL